MTVWFDESHCFGPGDLAKLSLDKPTGRIAIYGEPTKQNDLALWSGPIGAAVLRGAAVSRR